MIVNHHTFWNIWHTSIICRIWQETTTHQCCSQNEGHDQTTFRMRGPPSPRLRAGRYPCLKASQTNKHTIKKNTLFLKQCISIYIYIYRLNFGSLVKIELYQAELKFKCLLRGLSSIVDCLHWTKHLQTSKQHANLQGTKYTQGYLTSIH